MIRFFDVTKERYSMEADIVKDLKLDVIVRAMANKEYGDAPYIREILLRPLFTKEGIDNRRSVVMTACEQLDLVERLRKIIVETSEQLDSAIKAIQDCRGKHLTEQTLIGTRMEALQTLVKGISDIDELIQKKESKFTQTSLQRFYQEFYQEISRERLQEQRYLVENLNAFKEKGEILLRGNMGEGFHLQKVEILDVREKAKRVSGGIFSSHRRDVISDESVYESGVEFTNWILMEVLESCFPYLQHWQELLLEMKKQVVFLAGCGRLYQRGKEEGLFFCEPGSEDVAADSLYELSLALQSYRLPVSNSIDVTPYDAVIVTGANQGGKSTYLRSMGIAQVMCQAGVYVPAKAYPQKIYKDIFPHFTRREDASMNMGKFEEELKRMMEIMKKSKEGCLLLLNESFATTTEITAYQIAMDLIHACLESGITVWMVTHITRFAKEFFQEKRDRVLFLSAGRTAENEKQYTMVEKPPGDTSYGLELYDRIIGQ